MPLSAGTRLGPYEILSPLGAGGMGEVYRARDSRLGRDVAIKVLPQGTADANRERRFETEARAASALNHPNILTIYDVGEHDGAPYLVSELLEGETLRRQLDRRALSVRGALDVGIQIARGLAAAHGKGILHRDLKPDNLMVTRDGIKILDFGLAKLLAPQAAAEPGVATATVSPATETGTVLGTAGYMAPEQVRGETVDAPADLFALGTVLLEAASGRRPFHRKTRAETMTAILREDPFDDPSLAAALPPALRSVLRRCLAKQSGDRFQSAGDLVFALEAVRDGLDTSASAPTPLADAAPSRRSAPWVGRALPGLLGAAALAAVAAWALRPAAPSLPAYRQLTFGRGPVWSARFAPEGGGVHYSAAWGGGAVDTFSVPLSGLGSRSLGLEECVVVSVSARGELAVLLRPRFLFTNRVEGTLARVAPGASAPRELLPDVMAADWLPDGETLAVARRVGIQDRLELLPGGTLHAGPSPITLVRVSPDGRWIAFGGAQTGLSVVTAEGGEPRVLTTAFAGSWLSLAWSPESDELWYGKPAGSDAVDEGVEIHAVDLAGNDRVLARMPGGVRLLDVARDGRALISLDYHYTSLVVRWPGPDQREQELRWRDQLLLQDLSPDGESVLVRDYTDPGVVLMGTSDGGSPVRLGRDVSGAVGLSANGAWVLAQSSGAPGQLVLLPTGAGEERAVTSPPGVRFVGVPVWVPDDSAVVVPGIEPDGTRRLFLVDVAELRTRPLSPPIAVAMTAVSPDGGWAAGIGDDWGVTLYPVRGGDPRPTAARLGEPEELIGWSADGRTLLTHRIWDLPSRIYRTDLSTGEREVALELAPDRVDGLWRVNPVRVTPDTRAWAYSYSRVLSRLHLVEGLR